LPKKEPSSRLTDRVHRRYLSTGRFGRCPSSRGRTALQRSHRRVACTANAFRHVGQCQIPPRPRIDW
jgi:hypothetical protein